MIVKDVSIEQVIHARKNNILILRTLDLLRLLRLKLQQNILESAILDIFTQSSGWLKVTEEEWSLMEGQQENVQLSSESLQSTSPEDNPNS